MAFKIVWSQQARADLQAIVLFIAQDNPTVAELFGYQLLSKVDLLIQFPLAGRVVPEENDESIRGEIVFRPCRIIYKLMTDEHIAGIARVWHGARGKPEIPSNLPL